MKKWLIKNLLEPINKILGNHLIQSLLSYFSFRLLETQDANRYLANVMLIFAVTALIFYLLERVFNINTPIINVGKIFKSFRQSKKLEDPKEIERGIEMTVNEGIKIYNYLEKKGLVFYMKNLLKLIYINKITLSGLLIFALYLLDGYFGWSTKWNLPQEWQYTLTAAIFTYVSIAITGRGLEKLTWLDRARDFFAELKAEEKALKEQHKEEKLREKYAPIVQALMKQTTTVEMQLDGKKVAETLTQQPPLNNVRQVTKEELERMGLK